MEGADEDDDGEDGDEQHTAVNECTTGSGSKKAANASTKINTISHSARPEAPIGAIQRRRSVGRLADCKQAPLAAERPPSHTSSTFLFHFLIANNRPLRFPPLTLASTH
uniref:Uncharacterized protein n=1 Tax=Plectus sambesii TaxID=2011161 RepID=A0A914WRE1_9BILA